MRPDHLYAGVVRARARDACPPPCRTRGLVPLSAAVADLGPERIGSALRRLAEDLVSERRRVALLERENRRLKTELEKLRAQAGLDPTPQRAHPGSVGGS
jgi:hypothetical protein